MNKEKIDFVILWVDGNDPKWISEKEKYSDVKGDKGKNRFRDWENLKYLFRGIEKYAPWVNKIFFVTWGHLPKWLDTTNPKIRVVKHEEFIPKEYLPTFNSNVIELNLHRIKDLSEEFVLLNDDLFILKDVEKEDFFKDGKPRDVLVEYKRKNPSKRFLTLKKNNLEIVTKYFNKHQIYTQNKGYKKEYGLRNNISNYIYLKKYNFNDFLSFHLNQNFLKSMFFKVWENELDKLDTSCKNKFRADNDIGQSIIRYFQLFEGKFSPYSSLGKYYIVKEDNTKLLKEIKSRKCKFICINDANKDVDFEKSKLEINSAFEEVFPDKSKFEK